MLGPLLFLCHINDRPECFNLADDCPLYIPINYIEVIKYFNKTLTNYRPGQRIGEWNLTQRSATCLVPEQKSHFYTINDQILKQVQDNPYLGLTISNNLKWKTHINNICKKANSTLGFLRRNFRHCPNPCRKKSLLCSSSL